MMNLVIVGLLALGCLLMFLAGLGVLRMPDVFSRMHAATKGASLGVALLLLAAALHFQTLGVTTKALFTVAFVFLTAPVAAHMLSRSAYHRRSPMARSVIDEAEGKLLRD